MIKSLCYSLPPILRVLHTCKKEARQYLVLWIYFGFYTYPSVTRMFRLFVECSPLASDGLKRMEFGTVGTLYPRVAAGWGGMKCAWAAGRSPAPCASEAVAAGQSKNKASD